MSEITRILGRIDEGDPSAPEQLLPLVYEELKNLAAAKMQNERPDHTLQATALVHEAYVRLVDVDQSNRWNSRRHFFAAAAEAMRRILIEDARKKDRQKHGSGRKQVTFEQFEPWENDRLTDLVALDEALNRLAEAQPDICEIVKLRFFAGLTIEQVADTLGVSVRTVSTNWAYAKAWLFRELKS